MIEDLQKQRATFPTLDNAVDAAAKYRSDYDRANTEYNRFHARSEPAAQLAEQAAYADPSRMNPTFVNARSPRVYRNTQYSPNYPGDKYTTKFKVGSGGNRGLKSLPRGEYYDDMKDTYDFLMNEMYKPDARRYMDLEPYPNENNVEAIPATSYLDPTADDYFLREFGQYMKRFLPGYDIEQDEFRYDPPTEYVEELPIYDGGFGGETLLNPERSNREYSKFQVNANEALEREIIQNSYDKLRMIGKDPMFFKTSVTTPGLIDAFKEEGMYKPGMDLMSLPYDADMSPSLTYEDIERLANTPRLEADLNLQDVMDAHDALGLDLDTNRFIKRANKAGVKVAARGGIMNL